MSLVLHSMSGKEIFMKFRMFSHRRLAGYVIAGVLVVGLASGAMAQGSPGGPPAGGGQPATINPKLEERARELSESRLRSAEMDAALESEKGKKVQAAIANMKEDFKRIQVLRNDIARNLVARKPLDYTLVSVQTAEINKRANRLNVYILAHATDVKEQKNPSDLQAEEMIGALVRLCKLIDNFTENPALKKAATLDVKAIEKIKDEKAKADRDLVAIIKLSASIQKASDSLKVPQ